MRLFWLWLTFGFSLTFAQSHTPLHILVSVLPQKELIQALGGDSVQVTILVPNGKSPELYEPSLEQMKNIQNAVLFFGVGMPFEQKWVSKFQTINPHLTYHNLYLETAHSESLKSLTSTPNNHAHNPHIWLSLEKSKKHIRLITDALQKLSPQNTELYESNAQQMLQRIITLQNQIHTLFSEPNASKTFLVYHSAFEDFAHEFGLQELSLEYNGKELKGQDLARLIKQIKSQNLHALFAQPQFSPSRIQALSQELDLRTILLDPLQENWLQSFKIYACAIAFSLTNDQIKICIDKYFKEL